MERRQGSCILWGTMKRILTAAVLIPVVLLLVLKAPFWLITLVSAAVAGLAAWEYLDLADESGAKPPRIPVLVSIGVLFRVRLS